MLRMVRVECQKCKLEENVLVDKKYGIDLTDKDLDKCSKCGCKTKMIMSIATHHRHGSWSLWSV